MSKTSKDDKPKEKKAKPVKEKKVKVEKAAEDVVIDAVPEVDKYDELMDKYLRALAEFDNFKKRTDKEKSSMYQNGVISTVLELLPILDNFERALSSVEDKESGFYKGIDMIFKQFIEALTKLGVESIESIGQPFDHNLHAAVAHVEDENLGENVIVDEMLKGYKLKDRVIRHSMVRVAN
ncbi:MAG: nucleotide exchange factor GrpE [Defluviitaleaceae bacterium]|nr:nucleotide exchange factor GrpE [Defluviitaleaceae bacterium]